MNRLLWWRPPCLLRTVIVNLKSDRETAYRGVLWSARGRWLTFKNVDMLRAGEQPRYVDGELVIDRDNVETLQVLP